MIKTIKLCLYKAVGRKAVEFYYLLTLLSDIQNVINSRPLTYRCSSDMGIDIISPVNFISSYIKEGTILRMAEDESSTFFNPPSNSEIVSSLRIRDDMLQRFRRLFYNKYLLSLMEQCKDLYQWDFENKIKVGDIVLIKNPAKTCLYWPLGRVLSLNIGDDGNVRFVNLKKGDGSNHTHSIKYLYPIELSLTHTVQLGKRKLTLRPHLTLRILIGAEVKCPAQKRSKKPQMILIFGISLLEINWIFLLHFVTSDGEDLPLYKKNLLT